MQSILPVESEQWAKLRVIVDSAVRGSGEGYFLGSPATNPLSSNSFTKRGATSSVRFIAAALGFLHAISCKTVGYSSAGGSGYSGMFFVNQVWVCSRYRLSKMSGNFSAERCGRF